MNEPARAPFSIADRSAIRAWQHCELVHPLTCLNRGDGNHHETRDLGVLEVDGDGLYCPDCDYRQTWVPAVFVGPTPGNPFTQATS